MALTSCSECGHQVSDRAAACPHCGAPMHALASGPPARNREIVIIERKSVGLAVILTVIFGPLGMLYSTVSGGLVMMAVSFVVALLTYGLGLLITWPICIIWGANAASLHNKRLVNRQGLSFYKHK